MFLQSCAIHSNFPFVCFLKKCRQDQSQAKHLSARIKRNRTPKLKGTMIGTPMFAKRHKVEPKKGTALSISTPRFSNNNSMSVADTK